MLLLEPMYTPRYTYSFRDNMKVKCLAQEDSVMALAMHKPGLRTKLLY